MSTVIDRVGAASQTAYSHSVQDSTQSAATYLQDVLSQRLAAYVCGLKEGRTIARWSSGETTEIRHENEQRLRSAYAVVKFLDGFYAPATIRAWFLGMNPRLDDESPADVLRSGEGRQVLAAARAFATGD
jgi:hypothetical protein